VVWRSQWVEICWGGDPGQVLADPGPEVIVAAGGDRLACGVAKQLAMLWGVTVLGVALQVRHQRRGDGLPAGSFALFPQEDQALGRVEILRA